MRIAVEIRLRGWLAPQWFSRFDEIKVEHPADGNSRLAGALQDQAELMGLLNRLTSSGATILDIQVHSYE